MPATPRPATHNSPPPDTDRGGEAERLRWENTFRKPDPWSYDTPYEVAKRNHVLELLPDSPIHSALEVGCAEGHFTALLSPRVSELTAIDISERALERAKTRCADAANVTFVRCDIHERIPDGPFDLIMCTEVLYYLYDRFALEDFMSRAVERLKPGGHIVLEHVNMVSDDPTQTGFDFNEIGTDFIAGVFAAQADLEFLLELKTPLYKAQQFRRLKRPVDAPAVERPMAREVVQRDADFQHPALHRGGCAVTRAEAIHCWETAALPVLMYHRVADSGAGSLAPYRVGTAMFERQIAYLKRHGYRSRSIGSYVAFRQKNPTAALPGRPIAITFDDAYDDFFTTAWPILRSHGFTATLFVPVGFIGGHAEWDAEHGDAARMMTWEQLKAASKEGVEIASHGLSHTRLPNLDEAALREEIFASRNVLASRLDTEIAGFSYPYTQRDQPVRQAVASAGYRYAVVGKRPSTAAYDAYEIPRIEVLGTDSMDAFVNALPRPSLVDEPRLAHYLRLRAARDRRTYMR